MASERDMRVTAVITRMVTAKPIIRPTCPAHMHEMIFTQIRIDRIMSAQFAASQNNVHGFCGIVSIILDSFCLDYLLEITGQIKQFNHDKNIWNNSVKF